MTQNVTDDPLFWEIYARTPGWNKNSFKLCLILDQIADNPIDSEPICTVVENILEEYYVRIDWMWNGIIKLAVHTDTPRLQQLAFAHLDKVKNQVVYVVFLHWYSYRNPILEPLILTANPDWQTLKQKLKWNMYNVIYMALKMERFEQIVPLNRFTITTLLDSYNDPDPTISANAHTVLQEANLNDLHQIAEVWNWNRNPILLEILLEQDFFNKAPAEKFPIILALKFGRLDPALLDSAERVHLVIDVLRDKDPDIAANARLVLSQLSKSVAQEAVCQLILKGERPDLVENALEAGYAPANLTNRAVFYLLTEQWEKYAVLGMDPLMVQMVYRTGAADLRKRLSRHIQASGRPELLQLLAGSNRALTAADLSREAGRILIETLEKEQKWGQLWGLLPELSLRRGLQVLNRLAALPDWQPANQTEEALFAELKTLAAGPMLTSAKQIERFIPASLKLYSPWLLQFCESPGDATNDFNLFQNFKAGEGYAALPESLKNTLAYIEALMRYRWQYAIELDEVETGPLSQFDVELA